MNSKIKQIIKKISAVVFGLVFISQAFVADIALAGVTPVFYSTLGLKNRTQSTATWQTSVPASAGERIAFDVYYKNTISGTIAQNTKIRLDFEDNTGGQLRFKAYAYADNASYVYSLGDVVISNSNGYNFTFDSTAKTYPNHQTTADNVNVTFVQSNSVLVNVGQVSGGDQYDGHVVFEGVISGSTQTQQAQFNNASNDFKTLRVKNRTRGDTSWQSSVTANPGDKIAFDIYYHNTGEGSTAHNTKAKLTFPTSVQSQITVNGSVSADNAISALDTAIVTLNSNTSNLTFDDTGSWYPHQTTAAQSVTISKSYGTVEFNIGDVAGTCQDQGHMVFEATLSSADNPNLTITKSVRNITDGQSYYSSSVSADPGERLGFKIVVASNGQTAANNVYVSDTLPSNLIYRDNLSVSSGYSSGDITSGINLGTINSGNSVTITFEADVQSASYFSNGTVTLTNTAYASATNVSQRQASASVNVANTVNPVQTSNFTINKMVRNISKGETNWQNFVEASPGDQVEFYLSVTNTGSTAANGLYVKDTLPVKMTYLGNVKMDGYYNSGNVASASGIYIGDLSASQSRVVIFQAQVLGETEFNFGSTNVVNTATVYNASNSAIDSAIVAVNKRAVAGAETEVNTGLKEDLMSYLLLPALLAIVLMFVLRNQLFKVDKWLAVRGADNRVYQSQKTLDQKINQIREKENRK